MVARDAGRLAQVIGERRTHQLARGGRRVGHVRGRPPARAAGPCRGPSGWPRRRRRRARGGSCRPPRSGCSPGPRRSTSPRAGGSRSSGVLAMRPIASSNSRRPPGARQPPGTDVVVEVDLAVLPPHRMVELERDLDQLVAERLQLVQPAADDVAERVDAEVTPIGIEFDHSDFDGVHVHVRRFAVQQDRIPAAQPFHRCPLPIKATILSGGSSDNLFGRFVLVR